MMQTHFPPEERLAILKATDSARKWYSLDDKRVCVICDRVFTGWQIEIQSDQQRALFSCLSDADLPVQHQSLVPLRSLPGSLSRERRSRATRIFSLLSRTKNQFEKMAVSGFAGPGRLGFSKEKIASEINVPTRVVNMKMSMKSYPCNERKLL